MNDCGGLAAIGLLFTLILGTAMGADPIMGIIVLSIVYVSVCM